ncbi:MAG: RNA methyltransferase [Candidatus Aminicenantes bacterium]|nr:MAG: RNA methyltransferase [Candidatus Aminicenantes bacterium]
MPTKERVQKVERVLSLRQPDLRIVLEEVTNTHNASAVVRTCDAAGILYLDIISSTGEPFPVNEAISTRAEKWLHFSNYRSTKECLSHLKQKGFKIAATCLGEKSVPHTDIDYTQPLAVVFGNESEGISEEARDMADYVIKIPMVGMAQSLNLSVSVGIILYEAMKQRMEKEFYKEKRLSHEEFKAFLKAWLE